MEEKTKTQIQLQCNLQITIKIPTNLAILPQFQRDMTLLFFSGEE